MSDDDQSEYDVGYRKPPKSGQWQPGQSGNPTGKRKANKKGFATDLLEAFALPVDATVDGKAAVFTAKEAIVKALVDKAVKGSKPALKMLLDLRDHADAKGDMEPLIVDMTAEVARCL